MNNEFLRVINEKDLVRDPSSGAILNIGSGDLQAYRRGRESRRSAERRIDQLEKNVSDILRLLSVLVEEKK